MLHKKILEMFQEFWIVSQGLYEECEVFKEINKQAQFTTKHNQVSSPVDDSTKLVQEYADHIQERQVSFSLTKTEIKHR